MDAHLSFSPSDLATQLRAAGRVELVHYAGAAHRDRKAERVCLAYLETPWASDAQLIDTAAVRP